MLKRMHRIFWSVWLVAILGGCTNKGLQPDRSFTAGSNKAIVVVGIASTVNDERVGGLGLWFGRYDPNTGEWLNDGALSDKFHVAKETRVPFNFSGKTIDATAPSYVVVEVNPGDWVLWGISNTFGMANRATRLIPPGDDKLSNARGPRFTVRPGEIVYIGTFHVNPVVFPAQLVRMTREDAAAHQAVAGYPRVQGNVSFRAVRLEK